MVLALEMERKSFQVFNIIYTSFCWGAGELVAIIRHDMQRKEWEAVARVIVYGTTLDYFPVQISKTFMTSAFIDENSIKKDELISSFMNYISRDEKETPKSSKKNSAMRKKTYLMYFRHTNAMQTQQKKPFILSIISLHIGS